MRILVTGSRGMLGTAVVQVFKNDELILTGSSDLDVSNKKQVMSFAKSRPDLILHLAAMTDLSEAEKSPSKAIKTNINGTKNIVNLAKKLDIPIVFISSAMVFDGKRRSYTELDNPNPQNQYGKTKQLAEVLVRAYPKHYIVRSGWAFGGGPELDKKFINKIFKQIQSGQKKLYGISDLYGNPTYTLDFAKTLKNIIEKKAPFGTYNVPGKGIASRFDFMKEFVRLLGISKEIELVPLTLKKYKTVFTKPFPYIKHEVLDSKKIEKSGLSAMRDWRKALKDYVRLFSLQK